MTFRLFTYGRLGNPPAGLGFWVYVNEQPRYQFSVRHGEGWFARSRSAIRLPYETEGGEHRVATLPDYERFEAVYGAVEAVDLEFWFESEVKAADIPKIELRTRVLDRVAGSQEVDVVPLNVQLPQRPDSTTEPTEVSLALSRYPHSFTFFPKKLEEQRDLEPRVGYEHALRGIGTYNLPSVSRFLKRRQQVEGYRGLKHKSDFLQKMTRRKRPKRDTGTSAGNIASELLSEAVQKQGYERNEVELAYLYLDILRHFQKAGHRQELSMGESAKFILENWHLGDRGFFDKLVGEFGRDPVQPRTPPPSPKTSATKSPKGKAAAKKPAKTSAKKPAKTAAKAKSTADSKATAKKPDAKTTAKTKFESKATTKKTNKKTTAKKSAQKATVKKTTDKNPTAKKPDQKTTANKTTEAKPIEPPSTGSTETVGGIVWQTQELADEVRHTARLGDGTHFLILHTPKSNVAVLFMFDQDENRQPMACGSVDELKRYAVTLAEQTQVKERYNQARARLQGGKRGLDDSNMTGVMQRLMAHYRRGLL